MANNLNYHSRDLSGFYNSSQNSSQSENDMSRYNGSQFRNQNFNKWTKSDQYNGNNEPSNHFENNGRQFRNQNSNKWTKSDQNNGHSEPSNHFENNGGQFRNQNFNKWTKSDQHNGHSEPSNHFENNGRQFRNQNDNKWTKSNQYNGSNEPSNHFEDRSEVNRNNGRIFRNKNFKKQDKSDQNNGNNGNNGNNETSTHLEDRSEVNKNNGKQFRNKNVHKRNKNDQNNGNTVNNEPSNHVRDKSKYTSRYSLDERVSPLLEKSNMFVLHASTFKLIFQNRNFGETPRDPLPLNPYTKKPYTKKYHRMLQKRMELPVWKYKDQFMEMLDKNKISIVVGETGSVPATLPHFVERLSYLNEIFSDPIPQWCIEYSNSMGKKLVACTQPRKRPAVSLAERVSQEMEVQLGETVGYSIRFENVTSIKTKLNLFNILKRILKSTTLELPLWTETSQPWRLVMSYVQVKANVLGLNTKHVNKNYSIFACKYFWSSFQTAIDGSLLDEFIKYFKNAPVLKIPGFTHPVELIYSPSLQPSYADAAVRQAVEIHRSETKKGDILIFLTGQEEINKACTDINKELRKYGTQLGKVACIPLYSTLSQKAQKRIYEQPPKDVKGTIGRKIIISTNIAETSLTIDGVTFVIDSGYTKQKTYDPKTRMESLQVTDISKASANQRKGRAGRTAPGKCFRLYTEAKYNEMKESTKPEILRSNLATLVLSLKKLGIHDVLNFDYIDAPDKNSIANAIEILKTLEALDSNGGLTNLGASMADFPLEPQLSRMLILAKEFDCTEEILTIAAMLSVPNCYVSSSEKKTVQEDKEQSNKAEDSRETKEYREAKCCFSHSDGDHHTLLNVYNEFIENKQSVEWCEDYCVKHGMMVQAKKARDQLSRIMKNLGLNENYVKIVYDEDDEETDIDIRIGKTLASGFFMQVAKLDRFHKGVHYYTCNGNFEAQLQQNTSCINADYAIYNEFIKTKRSYISIVSRIEPHWLPLKNEISCAEEPTHIINPYDNLERKYETYLDEDYDFDATSSSDQLFPERSTSIDASVSSSSAQFRSKFNLSAKADIRSPALGSTRIQIPLELNMSSSRETYHPLQTTSSSNRKSVANQIRSSVPQKDHNNKSNYERYPVAPRKPSSTEVRRFTMYDLVICEI
ncbi:Pre-mRNA-splicing factor ATP-dependent RNA helicase DHX15 [Nymphon striatum]|nr:Pre-mRNA-splicing factor ATP-dependent RNA helicase DHX15 [Nymphon striatum]